MYRIKNFNSINEKIVEINDIVKKDKIFKNKEWKSIKISIANTKFSLIPEEFFNSKKLNLYLNKTSSYSTKSDIINFCFHKNLKLYNIYAVEKKLLSWCKKSFKNMSLFHESSALINGFYKINESKGTVFYIYFDLQVFHILIFKNKKLLYYNFFLIEKNKFLKYIFLVINELKIDRNNIKLVISGKDLKNFNSKLKEYFKSVSTYKTNDFTIKTKESNTISLLFNHYL